MGAQPIWPNHKKTRNRTGFTETVWFQCAARSFQSGMKLLRPLPLGLFPMDGFALKTGPVDGLGQSAVMTIPRRPLPVAILASANRFSSHLR